MRTRSHISICLGKKRFHEIQEVKKLHFFPTRWVISTFLSGWGRLLEIEALQKPSHSQLPWALRGKSNHDQRCTHLVICFWESAMAYSATTVFPADVCAATNTESWASSLRMACFWNTSSSKGHWRGSKQRAEIWEELPQAGFFSRWLMKYIEKVINRKIRGTRCGLQKKKVRKGERRHR